MIGIDAAGIDRRIMLLSRYFNRGRNRGGLLNYGMDQENCSEAEIAKALNNKN